MRVLGIRQPWASLIISGEKDIDPGECLACLRTTLSDNDIFILKPNQFEGC